MNRLRFALRLSRSRFASFLQDDSDSLVGEYRINPQPECREFLVDELQSCSIEDLEESSSSNVVFVPSRQLLKEIFFQKRSEYSPPTVAVKLNSNKGEFRWEGYVLEGSKHWPLNELTFVKPGLPSDSSASSDHHYFLRSKKVSDVTKSTVEATPAKRMS